MAASSRLFSLSTCLFTILVLVAGEGHKIERHNIKIVDEPSSYGIMNSYQGNSYVSASGPKLKMRITPSNFSGPTLFRRFIGKCYSKTYDNYKYEFCPFSNVTQHEQSLRWNPYSGILGVFEEWEIANNTFVAMVMREGDKCGDRYRSMKVFFVCGDENKILNVTEPDRCNYHMNFSTPYVCHKQAMLVYPTLSRELQTEWGLLMGELHRGEITQKGYDKYLAKVFVKAGYSLSLEQKRSIADHAVEKEKLAVLKDGQFENLYKCTEEYQKLQKEVEELRTLLEDNKNAHDQQLTDLHSLDNDGHMMDD